MPQQHLTAEDWITRDDMAFLTRKDGTTIRRDEREHQLKTRVDKTGRALVNVAGTQGVAHKRIRQGRPTRCPSCDTPHGRRCCVTT
jgi:hypothetical protein